MQENCLEYPSPPLTKIIAIAITMMEEVLGEARVIIQNTHPNTLLKRN
jgi:hypothetical protein